MEHENKSKVELIKALYEAEERYNLLKQHCEKELSDLTQIKETLNLSEQKYRSTIESAPVGMHFYQLMHDGRLIFTGANQAANKLLGVDNSIFIGKEIEEAFPPLKYTEIPERYRLAASKGIFWKTEQIEYNEGKIKGAFSVTAFQTEPEKMVAMFFDITESKKAQQQLKIFMESVDASTDAIGMSSPEGRHYYQNKAFDHLFGKIGEYPPDTLYVDKEVGEEVFATVMAGVSWNGEVRMYGADRRILNVYLRAYAAKDEKNEIKVLVGVHTDITEWKQVEHELIRAKEKAEESDRLKTAFLANMSHEIRTPMNGILGFSDLLKTPGLSGEEQKNYITIIERSGRRMLNIINDIIDISKIEAGLVEMHLKESNVNDQLRFIHDFFAPEAREKGLTFEYKSGLTEKDALLLTDREKLFAILTNLVKNALKYTRKGSVQFGYEKKVHFLEFFVKDTGIGIAPSRIEAIFERFIQADIEDRHAIQGAGLGLSISKAYVEMLGGTIWVESLEASDHAPGGSTFYFTIPFKAVNSNPLPYQESIPDTSSASKNNKLKVLIAEDDPISQLLLEIAVKDICHTLLKANNGREVLKLFQQNPDTDVILMDMRMPELNGYETTRLIRQQNKDLIIIGQSAYGMADEKEKALEAGCNDYITKPVDKQVLFRMIELHLKTH